MDDKFCAITLGLYHEVGVILQACLTFELSICNLGQYRQLALILIEKLVVRV